jgi:hypothetical protein
MSRQGKRVEEGDDDLVNHETSQKKQAPILIAPLTRSLPSSNV